MFSLPSCPLMCAARGQFFSSLVSTAAIVGIDGIPPCVSTHNDAAAGDSIQPWYISNLVQTAAIIEI